MEKNFNLWDCCHGYDAKEWKGNACDLVKFYDQSNAHGHSGCVTADKIKEITSVADDGYTGNYCKSSGCSYANCLGLAAQGCTSCLKVGDHCFAGSIRIPTGITVNMFKLWGAWDNACFRTSGNQWVGELKVAGDYPIWDPNSRVCAFYFQLKKGWQCKNVLGQEKLVGPPKVKIRTKTAKLCIDVFGGNLKTQKPIGLWECKQHQNQEFWFDDGLIKVYHNDELCLSVWDGSDDIMTCECLKGKKNQWQFSGEKIQLKGTTRCIGASAEVQGQPLKLSSCSEAIKVGPPMGKIRTKTAKLCIDVWGGKLEEKKSIGLWECKQQQNQEFWFDDGLIKLYHNNELCLSVDSSDEIFTYGCTKGGKNQWKFSDEKIQLKGTAQCMGASAEAKGQTLKLSSCSEAIKVLPLE